MTESLVVSTVRTARPGGTRVEDKPCAGLARHLQRPQLQQRRMPLDRAARRLANMFEQGARRHTATAVGCLRVHADIDLRLHDVPLGNRRPDIVLYHCLDGDVILRPGDVLLVVEIVSPASETTDTVTKFAEYAKAGIAHYWIVRLDHDLAAVGTIELYRLDPARHVYVHDRTIFSSEVRKAETVGAPIEVVVEWGELDDLSDG